MNRRYIYAMVLAVSIATRLYGQENPNVTYSKEKEILLKLNTTALLADRPLSSNGETVLSYFYEDGQFRHPLTGTATQGVRFSTERFQQLRGWTVYGNFGLKTLKEKNLPYASLVNPLTDNPYQIMDSLQGDWNKQFYDMGLKVASPGFANNSLRAGVDLAYQVATGARQMDPRSLDTENRIHLAPNLAYRITDRQQIALALNYDYWKNDLLITRTNTNLNYNIYKLLGLGEYVGASPTIMSSEVTRSYSANRYGAELSYLYETGNLRWLLSGNYLHHDEAATDGVTYPMKAGRHTYDSYIVRAAVDFKKDIIAHHIDLDLAYYDIANTEYQQSQNASNKSYETIFEGTLHTALRSQASLAYLIGKESSQNHSDWFAKATVSYSGWDSRYALPQGNEIIDRIDLGLRFNKAFSSWVVDIASNYNVAVKDEWNYTDKSYSSNFVADHIALPIHQYLASDRWSNGLSIQYRFRPFGKSNNQLYLKGSGNIETALSDVGSIQKGQSRYAVNIALGLLTF